MKFFYCLLLQTCVLFSLNAQTAATSTLLAQQKDSTAIKVEFESTFPGGAAGWANFLKNNLEYPKKAVRKNIQGTVVVQFIVDKDGTISDITALDGPDLLKEAAMDVIKKSPNWKPAVQNGRKVKSYKKQPVTFKLQQEAGSIK